MEKSGAGNAQRSTPQLHPAAVPCSAVSLGVGRFPAPLRPLSISPNESAGRPLTGRRHPGDLLGGRERQPVQRGGRGHLLIGRRPTWLIGFDIFLDDLRIFFRGRPLGEDPRATACPDDEKKYEEKLTQPRIHQSSEK